MTDTELDDVLAQQQRDRQQLLAYAARIDLQSDRILELEQKIAAESLEHNAKLAEAQALNAAVAEQLAGLRAEQEAVRVALVTQHATDRQHYEEQLAGLRAEQEAVRVALMTQLAGLRAEQEAVRVALMTQHATDRQRYEEELDELRAWRKDMMGSRTYRLLTLYRALYEAPVIGMPLRVTRHLVSRLRHRLGE